jgi:hypothetical protein
LFANSGKRQAWPPRDISANAVFFLCDEDFMLGDTIKRDNGSNVDQCSVCQVGSVRFRQNAVMFVRELFRLFPAGQARRVQL